MTPRKLHIHDQPQLHQASLLMGLTGWMDAGCVSTGVIEYLSETLGARKLGYLDPQDFYISNLPDSLEITAEFRPHTRIDDGLVVEYTQPTNSFRCIPDNNLVLFEGKEPHMAWETFADCIFSLCKVFDVRSIYFVGSIAGTTPHTREPRLAFTASSARLRDELRGMGLRPTSYEGPASVATYLTSRAPREDIAMACLIAEVPAYVQGYSPRSVETMLRLFARLLDLHVPLDELRTASALYDRRLSEMVAGEHELAERVDKLEKDYDTEAFERGLTDQDRHLG